MNIKAAIRRFLGIEQGFEGVTLLLSSQSSELSDLQNKVKDLEESLNSFPDPEEIATKCSHDDNPIVRQNDLADMEHDIETQGGELETVKEFLTEKHGPEFGERLK
jgi:hypothetical protein